MLRGFRDFIVRGNLIELAVAFVIGAAFATVVSSFVGNLMTPLIGKVWGRPDFGDIAPGDILVGAFITDLVAFVITAAAVYFFVVVPYTRLMERFRTPQEVTADATSEEIVLLREIRDLMAHRETAGEPS